jgi:ribose transport system ATP-binding protein
MIMSDLILEYRNVWKRFFGVPVLKDISLALPRGHILGLVGENGAGKSTLMNILGGIVPADSGQILLDGQPFRARNPADAFANGIAFIHQELNLFTNLSVAENIHIAAFPRRGRVRPFIDKRAMRARTKALLEAVDLPIHPNTLVENLSPGERQLVEIAKAVGGEARIILFDEPTTSLPARETGRLFDLIERLRACGVSMIYISHVLGDVLRLCDDIVVLRDGEVVGQGARGEFSLERLIALMVGRGIEQMYPDRATPSPQRPDREGGPATPTTPSKEVLLAVEGVSQPGIVHDISFELHRGEVLGVAGLMGSGRTELARILFGLDPMARGRILVHGADVAGLGPRERIRRGLAFLTEDRREEGLLMEASIEDNIALVSLPHFARATRLIDQRRLSASAAATADRVRLSPAAIGRQAAKTLSGGNQQKVVLAKWLLEQPGVFILDEPTRGIDVGAKHEVYRIINDLVARGAGALFISSEMEELIGMCDRILVMRNGEIADRLERSQFDQETILRAALRDQVLS